MKNKGITLIALIITIVILLILAGITIGTLTGENGIITNAIYAKFATEIRDLQEQLDLKVIQEDYSGSGTINDELKLDSNYNKLLYIEEGEIVYIVSEVNNREKEWLEQLGIRPQSEYFNIKFETSGGTEIAEQIVRAGKTVKKPTDPLKNNYEFLYWYYYINNGTEENPEYIEEIFDFSKEIQQDYTLYAKYDGEAIMTTAKSDGQKLFWNYREEITSVSFLKVDEISIPETAKESWEHIENNSECSQIAAYIEYDESGKTYKLNIISSRDIYAHTYADFYFYNFTKLKSINFENFDTSKCKSMASMFANCKELEELKNFKFNTSHVTYMNSMFQNCNKLTELDVSSFNTEDVKLMIYMFYGCNSLKNLDVSNFNTQNVTNMKGMFSNMTNVINLDISNFNTEKVSDMSYMFCMCKSISQLNFENFITDKVIDMSYMFQECSSLLNLDLSSFYTGNVKNMTYMFYQSSNLSNLDLSNFSFENVENISRMFSYCSKLNTEITINTSNNIQYERIFNGTATDTNSKVVVNYTNISSDLVDNIIKTATNMNVVKGKLIN